MVTSMGTFPVVSRKSSKVSIKEKTSSSSKVASFTMLSINVNMAELVGMESVTVSGSEFMNV